MDDTSRDVVLPDDACPTCGTLMHDQNSPLTYPVNGQKIHVPDVSHLRCPNCGEVVVGSEEVQDIRRRAFEIYREKHSLLTSEEIRSIRERFGLTQAAFAEILRLGSNTISRWESGRKVQTAALDVLLRLIRDLPGSYEYLRSHAA